MTRLRGLLLFSFIESFATILIERAVYFYTRGVLGYHDVTNLWIALGLGVAYVAGALASHRLSRRWGERRLLLVCVAAQAVLHGAMWASPRGAILITSIVLIGLVAGLKWPVVESYVSAGREPRAVSRAVGRFNLAWSSAVPLSLILAGPLIAWRPTAIFLLAGAINVVAFGLAWPLERRPLHLPPDHPARVDPPTMVRYRRLMVSNRWTMFGSYAMLFLLSPLMPGIFEHLHVSIALATGLSSVLDIARLAGFACMQVTHRWHGSAWVGAAALCGIPVGFFLALFGTSVAAVLMGEVIFGTSTALSYTAALYYALIIHNAGVDAGGAHEGLIGAGFCLGPLVGLIGVAAVPLAGSYVAGMLLGTLPLIGLCSVQAVRAMGRR
jgi:MFS family permease